MADDRIDKLEERLDKMDERQRESDKVIFNGLRDASAKMSKWLDEKAPHLMTREEHAQIDTDHEKSIATANRVIGKKKDRRLFAIGMVIPFLTAGAMKLMELI